MNGPLARRDGLTAMQVGGVVLVCDERGTELARLDAQQAAIWSVCDGDHDIDALVGVLTREIGAPVDVDHVFDILDNLADAGLITQRIAPPSAQSGVARRAFLSGSVALGVGVLGQGLTRSAQAKSWSGQMSQHHDGRHDHHHGDHHGDHSDHHHNAHGDGQHQEQSSKQSQEQSSKQSQEQSSKQSNQEQSSKKSQEQSSKQSNQEQSSKKSQEQSSKQSNQEQSSKKSQEQSSKQSNQEQSSKKSQEQSSKQSNQEQSSKKSQEQSQKAGG